MDTCLISLVVAVTLFHPLTTQHLAVLCRNVKDHIDGIKTGFYFNHRLSSAIASPGNAKFDFIR